MFEILSKFLHKITNILLSVLILSFLKNFIKILVIKNLALVLFSFITLLSSDIKNLKTYNKLDLENKDLLSYVYISFNNRQVTIIKFLLMLKRCSFFEFLRIFKSILSLNYLKNTLIQIFWRWFSLFQILFIFWYTLTIPQFTYKIIAWMSPFKNDKILLFKRNGIWVSNSNYQKMIEGMLEGGRCSFKQYRFLMEEIGAKLIESNQIFLEEGFVESQTKVGGKYTTHFTNSTILKDDESALMITSHQKAEDFLPLFYGKKLILTKFFFTKKESVGLSINIENVSIKKAAGTVYVPTYKIISAINDDQTYNLSDYIIESKETQEKIYDTSTYPEDFKKEALKLLREEMINSKEYF